MRIPADARPCASVLRSIASRAAERPAGPAPEGVFTAGPGKANPLAHRTKSQALLSSISFALLPSSDTLPPANG